LSSLKVSIVLKKNINPIVNVENKVVIHFVRGPFVEIKGAKVAEYKVEFIDNKTGKILYSTNIGNNCWCKCNIEYFVDWKINIYENGKMWHQHLYNATNTYFNSNSDSFKIKTIKTLDYVVNQFSNNSTNGFDKNFMSLLKLKLAIENLVI
jgi:hypothetical protein